MATSKKIKLKSDPKADELNNKTTETDKESQAKAKFEPTAIGVIYEEISLIESMDDDKGYFPII